ncbi:hypothetical protein [Qipengyuania sp.]|uniref:hypothetical protein n=1 Tax=Qipengyuania sp. TaxID=2004515 RepID=UPI0035C84219
MSKKYARIAKRSRALSRMANRAPSSIGHPPETKASESEPPSPAPPPSPQTPPQKLSPQQRGALTRKIRRAAREAERVQARRQAEAEAEEAREAALVAAERAKLPSPDAHGFDPEEYEWLPVRRRRREDGWTPQRQQDFIAVLAETGCVDHAAQDCGMSVSSAYRLRRAPGAEQFAAAWDVALTHASRKLLDVAFDRALRGTDEPVFDREGHMQGRRFRQNDRLLMFLLRAYMPDRFRYAHRDLRVNDEPVPADPLPMGEVLARLVPVPPPEPEKLMSPRDLEDARSIGDLMEPGEAPHWHSGKDIPEPEIYNEWRKQIDAMIHPNGQGHFSDANMRPEAPRFARPREK